MPTALRFANIEQFRSTGPAARLLRMPIFRERLSNGRSNDHDTTWERRVDDFARSRAGGPLFLMGTIATNPPTAATSPLAGGPVPWEISEAAGFIPFSLDGTSIISTRSRVPRALRGDRPAARSVP